MSSFPRIFFFSSFLWIISLHAISASGLSSPFQLIEQSSSQVIVVTKDPDSVFKATLTAWEKVNGQWQKVLGPISAVLGRNGMAPLGEKKEGDGRTPLGVYLLKRAFGYGPNSAAKLIYSQVGDNDFWVDDAQSPDYNRWVQTLRPETKSFERLKRSDHLYRFGIVIEYNMDPVVPGDGSAIFLHVWRGADQPTSGCVAISEDHIKEILFWLDLAKKPEIILED